MTNGPAIMFQVYDSNKSYSMGEQCFSPQICSLEVRSSEEFGSVKFIKILLGDLDKRLESVFYEEKINLENFEYTKKISLENIPDRGYLRVEIRTTQNYQALSNPIWF
jgi:hypothetical protein